MLVDSHAHLDMDEFREDLDQVLKRAEEAGVSLICTVGTGNGDWARTLEIAHLRPWLYAILGVHPHNAKEIDDDTYGELKRFCRDEKVRALGEIGLDFFRNLSPPETQVERFREQIALARELGLPIVVHDRDAHEETLEVLKSERAWECGGIVHCFSGDEKMARACIDMGFFISIPGTITFKNAGALCEIVRRLPLESLLIETDAPFLAPVPFRGKRNEPSYVKLTAKKVAEVRKISFEKVAEATRQNALRAFGIQRDSWNHDETRHHRC